MAVVAPRHGKESEVAKLLLNLADDPREVGTNTDDGFVFVVSEQLYVKYLDAIADPDPGPTNAEQAKRRPGRPRKDSQPAEAPKSDEEGDS